VPALAGRPSEELGQRNYQSPRRGALDFGPSLDNFSEWVIFASLILLAFDPTLWMTLKNLASTCNVIPLMISQLWCVSGRRAPSVTSRREPTPPRAARRSRHRQTTSGRWRPPQHRWHRSLHDHGLPGGRDPRSVQPLARGNSRRTSQPSLDRRMARPPRPRLQVSRSRLREDTARRLAHLEQDADLVVARVLDEEPPGGGVDHPVTEDGQVLEVDVPLLEVEGAVGE